MFVSVDKLNQRADAVEEIRDLAEAYPDKKEHVEIIRALTVNHRPDQVMAFGSRRPLKDKSVAPHYLAAVTAEQVWGWLPELWMYELDFARASYWMLQPLRPEVACTPPTAASLRSGGKPTYFPATNSNVDGLNCIPIDLDVGREGMPSGPQALGLIAQAVQDGSLPAPSYVALSGRGAYAIWQLRNPRGGMPARNEENEGRWKAILWRLVDATKQLRLEPDQNAIRLANWFKLPGTLDTLPVDGKETKSGNRVTYVAFTTGLSATPTIYTFDELEQAFGMTPIPAIALEANNPATALPAIRRASVRADGRDGSYSRRARVREIVALNDARGGMREGFRHTTLFRYFAECRALYGCLHPGEGVAVTLARAEAFKLNDTFNPPLPKADVERAMDQPKGGPAKRKQARAETIARELDVTPAEAEALGLKAIAPKAVREAIHQREEGEVLDRKKAHEEFNALIRKCLLMGWGLSQVAKYVGTSRQRVQIHQKQLRQEGRLASPPRPPAPTQAMLPGVG